MKSRHNDKGWLLCACEKCGRQHYVEPHGTTAPCKCSAAPTEHKPVAK